jgi:hypothetical protein
MSYRTGLANTGGRRRGGILSSVQSGEGLMCHFRGPGTIFRQSHKPGRTEADTIVKRGKSGAAHTCNVMLSVFFMIIFMTLVVLLAMAFQSKNMLFRVASNSKNNDNNNNAYSYDYTTSSYYNGYDSRYSSAPTSSGAAGGRRMNSPQQQGYRAVGEF